jgi:hypothetical protein
MRAERFYFRGNGGDIDSEVNHGLMRAADISNDALGAVMFGIVRYSFTIVATLCVAALSGDRAFGQVLKVIANSDGVVRFRYRTGDLKATGKPEQIIAGIPTTDHYARDIAFSADGHRLFFSVGSGSNAAQDMFPEYEDFMTGFVLSDGQVWGRPVGVAVAKDGSLIVTEDGNGTLWRVAYRGDARTASGGGETARDIAN